MRRLISRYYQAEALDVKIYDIREDDAGMTFVNSVGHKSRAAKGLSCKIGVHQ